VYTVRVGVVSLKVARVMLRDTEDRGDSFIYSIKMLERENERLLAQVRELEGSIRVNRATIEFLKLKVGIAW